MEKTIKAIDCSINYPRTCRKTPFNIVCYRLDYISNNEDKALIDSLISKAKSLANAVYTGAANNAFVSRPKNIVLANCIAGVVSEYFWKLYLNEESETVSETPFSDVAAQIDLELIDSKKKIEVRSSFPRNGVEFAICHSLYEFDILGPYANAYKPGEIVKDYYVRTLFHMAMPSEIIEKIYNGNFIVYLTGGATWSMMNDNSLSKIKELTPPDSFIEHKSSYRVVPFSNALDSIGIKAQILKDK